MKNYEISNYALASSHNPRYIFLLKSPQLISNQHIYFDQTTAFIDTHQEPQLQPMTYYYLKFVITNRKTNKIKIIQALPLALLGSEWQSEDFLQHMLKFQGSLKQPEPNNPFMKEQMESGELRVNDEGWIYVKSFQSGFRKKLKLVNSYYAVPLLRGWKVDFFLRKYAEDEGPKVKISRLSFQNLALAGILKMINGRIFFQPRHSDYQRMVPLVLPQTLMDIIYSCLPHYKGTLPYSIFKRYDGDHTLLNKHLAQYVLQGKFVDWPLKFSHPVISIEYIQPMTCINLKQATLYEFGIPIQDYDAQENRLSNQIIKNFDPQSYSDRLKVTDRCYTFDCEGGNCYDDAFSFRRIKNGYNVSIHISDVPALVEGKPYLLERAHIRDQTIYIKNYYKSMFPEQLRDVMSLMASQPRLAFSLSLDISEDGKIDYQSVKFYPSIIKVTQNITHGDKISNAQDQTTFLGLAAALNKCKEVERVLTLDDIDTSIATAQLLFISSSIPTFIFNQNIKRLPQLIKHTQQHLASLYCQAFKLLKPRQLVGEISSQEASSASKEKSSALSSQSLVMIDKSENSSEVLPSSTILKDLQSNISSSSSGQRQEFQDLEPDSELETQQKSSLNPPGRSTLNHNHEFFRKVSSKEGSAAECYRFLDKLFRAADIIVDFSHPKNIENAFRECEKKHKDKIAELYFRTKLIMSKQHFQTMGRLCKQGKLKEFDLNSTLNASSFINRPRQGVEKVEDNQSTQRISQAASIMPSQPQLIKVQSIQTETIECSIKKVQYDASQKKIQINIDTNEMKLQMPESQHPISSLCNHLTYLLDSQQFQFCKLKPQELQQAVNQLCKIANDNNIPIIAKSSLQRMKDLNNQIQLSLAKEQFTEPNNVKPYKWNTPIRSGSSLHALTLLKNYSWIFQGTLLPLSALEHQKQVSIVRQYMNKIYKERSRQQSMELNGRMKNACRELDKIDFLFVLRQQPDRVWDFITITSPSNRVQFVYHQFIEEVEVDNPQKKVVFYTRVQGRFKGIFDFPIKLKVVLLQN